MADGLVALSDCLQLGSQLFVEMGFDTVAAGNDGVGIGLPTWVGMKMGQVGVGRGIIDIPVGLLAESSLEPAEGIVSHSRQ